MRHFKQSPHGTCCLLVLCILCWAVPILSQTIPVTHSCNLHINGVQKTLDLSCQHQQQGATLQSQGCNLVVYYNSTVVSLRSLKPFGIPTCALPKLPRVDLRSAAVNASEERLNRTEPIYGAIMWPLLYFYGGPSCHVLFESPSIRGVKLPKQDGEATQLLAFGGGLTATLIRGDISNNSAQLGMAILANSTLAAAHTHCSFNDLKKGCFYGSYTSHLLLNNVTMLNNTAKEGAAIYLVNSMANVSNSKLSYNNATSGGGAVYVKGGSSIFMSNCELLNNIAPIGGALGVYDAPFAGIRGCEFHGNNARSSDPDMWTDDYYKLGVGGAMYLEHSEVNITDTTFKSNKAVIDGGAVMLRTAHVNIIGSNFTDNVAFRHGGGIYAGADAKNRSVYSKLHVTNCSLQGNTAQANGGGIMIDKRANTTMINTTFYRCKSWSEGDGVCTVLGGQGTTHLEDDLEDDLGTELIVDNVAFIADKETDEKLFVGPFFDLKFYNTDLNQRSTGVVWRRRLCQKGEYVSPSGYCQRCPSYTFSLKERHRLTSCQPAPNNSFAPGGAVLVPVSGGWHGVTGDVPECSGCPLFVSTLDIIKRCPNPAACKHDSQYLASCHPDSLNSSSLSWKNYNKALCDAQDGYTGILCGTCIKGFGTTSPFSCARCYGAHVTIYGLGDFKVQPPSRAAMSGLYLAYWFALTCGLLVCVRFSVPEALVEATKSQPLQAAGATTAAELPLPGGATHVEMIPKEQHLRPAQDVERQQGVGQPHQQQQHIQQSRRAGAGRLGQNQLEHSKAIDITKVLTTYTQWAVLILHLPLSWLPWTTGGLLHSSQTTASTTGVPAISASWPYGVLSGRSASLDCFLQAWSLLQGDSVQQLVRNVFVRTVGSAIVVPFILFLSVLLLQLLFQILRLPFLRLLVKTCGQSQLFSRHVAHWIGVKDLQLDARGDSAATDVGCMTGVGGQHLPSDASHTSRATSASSLNSIQSYVSGSSFLGLGMFPSMENGDFWRLFVDNVVATVLAVSLTLYPTIARAAIGMLLCVRVSPLSPKQWVLDVRLQCPTESLHTAWGVAAVVLGVFLLVVCVAWPVGLAVMLVRAAHRGNLLRLGAAGATAAASTAAHTTARLAVRYADYDVDYEALSTGTSDTLAASISTTSCCHRLWGCVRHVLMRMRTYVVLVWDSVLDLHKLTLVLVSLCVMLHELHQLTFMIMVLGSYLVLVLLVKPWRSRAVWHLQVSALVLLLASCMGIGACTVNDALTYYAPESYMRYMVVIPWLIVAANACYLVLVVGYLLRCVWRELPRLGDLQKYIQSMQNKRRRRAKRGAGP